MKKVLLVEDNPTLQFLLTQQIESMALTIITANNGKERVEKAIGEKPRLILKHIMAPGIDRRQATRMIRSILGEAMAAPIPVKFRFRWGLLDSRLPRDSDYFLTAYNLGKKVAG